MCETGPAIMVDGLSFDYHGTQALCGISFSLQVGERVGLVGPNGAGKTTLLLHLAGLLSGQGTVRVLGDERNAKSPPRTHPRVGLVFSDPEDQLFMPTLEEDVAFGPLNQGCQPGEAVRRARVALERMGLLSSKDRSSHHLSDGEQRRAAIATVLAMEPSIWLLDEPTANLDPRGRRELCEILRHLPGTMVLASHDLDLVVQVCSRCLLLDGGALVANGPTRTVLTDACLMELHGLEVPWRFRLECGSEVGSQEEQRKVCP